MLVSPKGWTGPKQVDGVAVEGTARAHQIPIPDPVTRPEHLRLLEEWLRSYRPQELFDATGRLLSELAALAPEGNRRMGANPHANGGCLLRDLVMPDFRKYAADVPTPGAPGIGDTHVLGPFLRDVVRLNREQRNFRVFGPDETLSNGLAEADLLSAKATVGEADAQVRINEFDLSKAIIQSPIDGIVLIRSIEPGQTVAASFTAPQLFVIAEKLERMKLKVTIAEADIGRVAPGQASTFTVDAWPDQDLRSGGRGLSGLEGNQPDHPAP